MANRRPPLSEQDAAYAAAAWASGTKQKELARQFGYMGPGGPIAVCLAIGRFIDSYSGERATFAQVDDSWTQIFGVARKQLVRRAVENYLRSRQQ